MRKGKLFEGDALLIMETFQNATLENGRAVCEACLFELITESIENPSIIKPGIYNKEPVKINKVLSGDIKKYKVFLIDPETGETKKVEFGKKNDNNNEKSKPRKFRTVHRCGENSDLSNSWSCLK
tara:strand:- start:2060 stop:2434 length:375 start_codon:yes stop_codon:yes gene_type:complete